MSVLSVLTVSSAGICSFVASVFCLAKIPNWIRLSGVMSFHFFYLLDLNLFLVHVLCKLSHSSGCECGLHRVYVYMYVCMCECVIFTNP